MKKLFTFFAAALVSISMLALDGVNVMPSGLKATVNEDVTQMTVDYVLNTDATELYVEFFDADNSIVAMVEIEDEDLLTEGAHQTTIDLPLDDLEEAGTYKWTVHAYGGTTAFGNVLSTTDLRYKFYLPQDVVVDNSFESDYFGRIYVDESYDGLSDGMSAATKAQTRGIYVYDSQLNFVNGQTSALLGYTGGTTGAGTVRDGLKRLAIDEQGFVYVAVGDSDDPGVYRMDPANPAADFTLICATESNVNALEVVGNKLYTFEGGRAQTPAVTVETFNEYNISTIPAAAPVDTLPAGVYNVANADLTIRSDGRKGLWVIQHRYNLDAYNALSHINKKGQIDYVINNENNTDLLSNSEDYGYTYRGTLGLNKDKNLIALSSNKRAVVFTIDYDDEGIPALTKLCETPVLGGNIDGIAFDAADNLYVLSASVEQMFVFPISKEEGMNHCRVFAPSKYAFTIEDEPIEPEPIENLYLIGDNQPTPWTPAAGLPMEKTDDLQFEGTFDFTNDLSYFAFVSVQSEDWSVVNTHRFGGATNNQLVADGTVAPLAAGEYCLTVAPGSYHFVVDLEEMTCAVTEIKDALDNVNTDLAPVKILRDGQVLILRNGNEYNILGTSAR